jgi:hypothetical protein
VTSLVGADTYADTDTASSGSGVFFRAGMGLRTFLGSLEVDLLEAAARKRGRGGGEVEERRRRRRRVSGVR